MTPPDSDFRSQFLHHCRREAESYRGLAERALVQVSDAEFFASLETETNSLAVQVKHLGGNLRSRWRDFLTTDGEKADRDRDSEFIITPEDARASLMALWAAGWGELAGTLEALRPEDLSATVVIRSEPHAAVQAILRQLAHTAYHVGQIVQLARHWRGDSWQTLSVPRGGSEEFNRRMRERFAGTSST
ncbi:MAG TPA: DUF1572 family protein [Thermoanaerobaculia bacterium]|nr:DUF1572 family protein [Thermoanaerobaculia bacterium]